MKKNILLISAIICFSFLILNGCMRMALRSYPSIYQNFSEALFEECDLELARISIPANLKIMEGLLKSDPKNRHILRLLCMGYSGYALLFVEPDDPTRASNFYLRAREYGRRSLGDKGLILSQRQLSLESLKKALMEMGTEEFEGLFWFTLSWNGWLNLNLHQPSALAQLVFAEACLERIEGIDPDYFYGLPYVLMGVIHSARPKMLGGDEEKAKMYFQKAFELTQRRFLLVHYYCALHYAVRIQDRELFMKLIQEIELGQAAALPGACLINQAVQARSQDLYQMADDLFL